MFDISIAENMVGLIEEPEILIIFIVIFYM
jgi:hypothetical protein